MKLALVAITLLLLASCNRNKTAATNTAQGAAAAHGSKVTPTRISPRGTGEAPGKGSAQSAPFIENDRGGDPNKSALNVKIHP